MMTTVTRDTVRWFWARLREIGYRGPAWQRFALSVFLAKHDGFYTRNNWHMIAGTFHWTRHQCDELTNAVRIAA